MPSPTLPPIRDELHPSRLTIAMWDFSWLHGHHPGGPFENWPAALAELVERGFNTVRLEAFPWVIGRLRADTDAITVPADPLANWGQSPQDFVHQPALELVEFLQLCRTHNIRVILSTWGTGCREFPAAHQLPPEEARRLVRPVWERTLDLLDRHSLLDLVLYVDLDQEFPYFSPIRQEFNQAGERAASPVSGADDAAAAMAAAGANDPAPGFTPAQANLVRSYFQSTLGHFQERYPGLRFTISLTGYWKEIRSLGLECLDVLELHFWMHGPRFDHRTGFQTLVKDRDPSRSYADYQQRIDATLAAIQPMLRRERENRLAFATSWADELAAPLVTTEAWGPWWHMDHPDLRWDWLRDWCEDGMQRAQAWELWGTTPWNYSHPYWENWHRDLAWYQKVNHAFLRD